MIMSFTPVNGIISYLRRIFRNTQMEVLNLVLIYLQNLMHADVTIHKDGHSEKARRHSTELPWFPNTITFDSRYHCIAS